MKFGGKKLLKLFEFLSYHQVSEYEGCKKKKFCFEREVASPPNIFDRCFYLAIKNFVSVAWLLNEQNRITEFFRQVLSRLPSATFS